MKPWYQSKTLWINTLMIVIAVVSVLQTSPIVNVEPEVWALVVALVNIPLRFITKQPIYGKEAKG